MKNSKIKKTLIWGLFDPYGKLVIKKIKRKKKNIIFFNTSDPNSFFWKREDLNYIFNLFHTENNYKLKYLDQFNIHFEEFAKGFYSRNVENLNYVNLKQLFRCYCIFFLNFFKKHNLNHILMGGNIGHGCDLLAYRIAKQIGIKTTLLDLNPLDINEMFCSNSIENTGKYKHLKDKKIISKNKTFLNELGKPSLEYSIKPVSKKNILLLLFNEFNYIVRRSTFDLKLFLNKFFDFKYKIRLFTFLKKNKKYDFISKNLPKKYIFFPLHEQPEATTISYGNFIDQAFACELISKKIPKNFKIIVKENPTQIDLRHRDKYFYKRMMNCKNVIFTNVNDDTKKIIKNSKLVFTITGTAGFEALCLDKPVIIFGKTWYSSLYGVYEWNENINIKKIIDKKFNRKKLVKTIQKFEKTILKGNFCKWNEQFLFNINKNSFSREKLSDITANTISKLI